MQTLGSPASVVAAIREDADAEVQRIQETAAAELTSIEAAEQSASVAIADREDRLAAARRENEERVAKQDWEGRRAAIEERERWIQRVVTKAQENWTRGDAPKRREQLNALLREGLSRMPRGSYEVTVSAVDRELVEVEGVVTRIAIAPIAGGCVITAGDVSFDNSFEARARRLEPEWRAALSGMYKP